MSTTFADYDMERALLLKKEIAATTGFNLYDASAVAATGSAAADAEKELLLAAMSASRKNSSGKHSCSDSELASSRNGGRSQLVGKLLTSDVEGDNLHGRGRSKVVFRPPCTRLPDAGHGAAENSGAGGGVGSDGTRQRTTTTRS